MAAATIASTSRPHVEGDMKIIFRKYTALADTNTDTFAAGTPIVGASPVQVSTAASVTCTVASNVITYNVSAGTPDVTMRIVVGAS